MSKEKVEKKLTHDVFTIGKYLTKLAEVSLPKEFATRHQFAIATLYSENKVIDVITLKGELVFVVEK